MACLDKIYDIMGMAYLGMSAAAPPTIPPTESSKLGYLG